ncbi:MAG: copper resistance protein CopC [Gemmatimonadetes bacterium]|nr:copper resistance protein CopC [Gemmatimonadota bacterium]
MDRNSAGRLVPAAPVVIVLAVLACVALALAGCGNDGSTGKNSRPETPAASAPAGETPGSAPSTAPEAPPVEAVPEAPFVQQQFRDNRTIHFASSDPPNNALLSAPPERVTVSFSSDLGSGSFISVKVDGREVTTGGMILPVDNRSVSVAVNPYAGTGNYAVSYAAYWSDGSYCEGSFGFSVKVP